MAWLVMDPPFSPTTTNLGPQRHCARSTGAVITSNTTDRVLVRLLSPLYVATVMPWHGDPETRMTTVCLHSS